MEEFVCKLLGWKKSELDWIYTLDQKYHVFLYKNIFDHFIDYDQNEDPFSIIYNARLDPELVEASIINFIIKDRIGSDFQLSDNIYTVNDLYEQTDKGTNVLAAYLEYNFNSLDYTTLKKLSAIIKELKELRDIFDKSKTESTFKYASKTRRR